MESIIVASMTERCRLCPILLFLYKETFECLNSYYFDNKSRIHYRNTKISISVIKHKKIRRSLERRIFVFLLLFDFLTNAHSCNEKCCKNTHIHGASGRTFWGNKKLIYVSCHEVFEHPPDWFHFDQNRINILNIV